ncbi:MAG: hypothetical protein ABIQ40_18835 [Bacteroidia bacterium]
MRIIFALSLVIVMLVQVFSKTIIFVSFIACQDYIAKELCENRFAPEKKCNGHCHLKKQMANDQKQAPFSSSVKSLDEIMLINDPDKGLNSIFLSGITLLFPPSFKFIHPSFDKGVFRPPWIA